MTRKLDLRPAALAALLMGASVAAQADSGWSLLNMPPGVTEISRKIYELHMLIFWICVVIGAAVFGVMIYSIATFRRSKGAVPDTTMVHNTRVEIAWTIVPVAILVGMAVPSGIDPNSVPHYLLSVDNPLVVPVGTKVHLLLTANDVIHSWWVPAFGVKKDAIPGVVNDAWFKVDTDKPGLYRGQCAELCGRDHGFMPIVVDVRSKDDFAAWLKAKAAEQKPPAAPQTAQASPQPASG